MSQDTIFRQVKLVKQLGQGHLSHVAWIPGTFAKVGKLVSLRTTRGEGSVKSFEGWDDGWKVAEVYGSRAFRELDAQRDAQKRWERVLEDH